MKLKHKDQKYISALYFFCWIHFVGAMYNVSYFKLNIKFFLGYNTETTLTLYSYSNTNWPPHLFRIIWNADGSITSIAFHRFEPSDHIWLLFSQVGGYLLRFTSLIGPNHTIAKTIQTNLMDKENNHVAY